MIYNVFNATQLQSALGKAVGGDRIVLAAGNYGTVNITNRAYASAVTIQSANASNPAHFDGLFVTGSKHLTFSGLDLGRGLKAGEIPESAWFSRITGSSNISLLNSKVHGSLDGNPLNDGGGLMVRDSSNFSMSGNTFEDLYRGAFVQRGANHSITNNVFEKIRVDGMNFAAVDRTTIDSNTFRDFHWKAGDHPDAIQFWNVNETRGSSNVTIKNNVILQGDGMGTQGIWIADPGAHGYKNFVIQNNLLYSNDMYNGIAITGGSGVQILGNTVLSSATDSKQLWIRLLNTSQAVVKGNVTDNFINSGGVIGLTESQNLILAKTPGSKSLIPNLSSPESVKDLIIAGHGYQDHGIVGVTGGGGGTTSGGGGTTGGGTTSSGGPTISVSSTPGPVPPSPSPAVQVETENHAAGGQALPSPVPPTLAQAIFGHGGLAPSTHHDAGGGMASMPRLMVPYLDHFAIA